MGEIRQMPGVGSQHGSNPPFGGDDGMEITSKEYIDAKADAVRAQNDARFAEVMSEIRALPTLRDNQSMKWNIWGAAIAAAGLIVGILAFAGDRFNGGVQVASVSVQQAQEAKEISRKNAEAIEGVNNKLDELLKMLGASTD